MKNDNLIEKRDLRLLGLLLTPSWLSGLISISCALTITIGVIAITSFKGSGIQQSLFTYQAGQDKQPNLTYTYQSVGDSFSTSAIVSDISLFVFWGLVGLACYMLVANVIRAFQEANKVRQELDYVHADRKKILRSACLHFGVRIIVILVWGIFIKLTLRVLLPYSIATAHAAALGPLNASNLLWATLSLTVIMLTAHINTVMLRLLFLRARLSSTSYIDVTNRHAD